MHAQINQLVRSLLQKDSLEECSVQELQQFADRHPYFGAAQLLLTKKLKAENSDRYNAQLQKTFLFFHNPLWVESLLTDAGDAEQNLPVQAENVAVDSQAVPAPGLHHDNTINYESLPLTNKLPPESPMEEYEEVEEIPADAPPILSIASIREEFDAPVKEDSGPVFEPYHTVDYFASQGIHVKEENKPEDKFGRQLKSFTEWLKTMKRLPATELEKQSIPATEKKVEILAEHSIEERDVITEAMAQVWEKQANIEKATEVYRKLSLLEPSKSAYFAAKIEDLKKIS